MNHETQHPISPSSSTPALLARTAGLSIAEMHRAHTLDLNPGMRLAGRVRPHAVPSTGEIETHWILEQPHLVALICIVNQDLNALEDLQGSHRSTAMDTVERLGFLSEPQHKSGVMDVLFKVRFAYACLRLSLSTGLQAQRIAGQPRAKES